MSHVLRPLPDQSTGSTPDLDTLGIPWVGHHITGGAQATHVLDRSRSDGHVHVRKVEEEVPSHDSSLHLAVGLVPLQVQSYGLVGGQGIEERINKERPCSSRGPALGAIASRSRPALSGASATCPTCESRGEGGAAAA